MMHEGAHSDTAGGPTTPSEHASMPAGIVSDTYAPNSQFRVTRSDTRGASRGSFGGDGFSFATAAGASRAAFVARLRNDHHGLCAAIVSLLASRYASVARTCMMRFVSSAKFPLSGRNRN
jgi:hypothetical protein